MSADRIWIVWKGPGRVEVNVGNHGKTNVMEAEFGGPLGRAAAAAMLDAVREYAGRQGVELDEVPA